MDTFFIVIVSYGCGVFSAIGAMMLGRWIGRRQVNEEFEDDWMSRL